MKYFCGQQKGLGKQPSPNYYQTIVMEVLHRFLSPAPKQKGLGS
jgi:hypothetical protein